MWLLRPPKSRRRWHVFTWLAAVPALVFVALVQVAGVVDEDFQSPDPAELEVILRLQHGWPLPWAQRTLHYTLDPNIFFSPQPRLVNQATQQDFHHPWTYNGTPILWTSWHAWPTFANEWRVAPLGATLNLLVAISIVGLAMLAPEVWLRRRGGPARIRIVDFLAIAATVACLFGLWKWDQGVVRHEHEIAARTGFTTEDFSLVHDRLITNYVGPDWLAHLVGNELLVPLFQRLTTLTHSSVLIHEVDVESLRELRHLSTVEVTLDFWFPGHGLEVLAQLPQVDTLVLVSSRYRSDYLYGDLAQLSNIEHLAIDCPIDYDDLPQLKAMSNLKTLSIRPDSLRAEELEKLRDEFNDVTITLLPVPLFP